MLSGIAKKPPRRSGKVFGIFSRVEGSYGGSVLLAVIDYRCMSNCQPSVFHPRTAHQIPYFFA